VQKHAPSAAGSQPRIGRAVSRNRRGVLLTGPSEGSVLVYFANATCKSRPLGLPSLSSINNQPTLRTHEDEFRHARTGSRCQQVRTDPFFLCLPSLSSINNQLTLRTHEDEFRHARSGSRCQQGRTDPFSRFKIFYFVKSSPSAFALDLTSTHFHFVCKSIGIPNGL